VLATGLERRGEIPVASGGLTDIWRGKIGPANVAIKVFRIYPDQNLKEAKEILWERAPIWMKLSHDNILPFRGVNMTLFQLALVYDWGRNGNITSYVAAHPNPPRVALLYDVTRGLDYLHSLDILHGDLKGANVLIDQRGRARLTEYGLAAINSDPNFTVAATPGAVGTSRWLAPEIMLPPRKPTSLPEMESKPADVFAFAMFAVEVFTGKLPFGEQKNEVAVLRISQGGRPDMPENAEDVGLTRDMWKLLESCWNQSPAKRPTMAEVARKWYKLIEFSDDDSFPDSSQPGSGATRQRARTEAPRLQTRTDSSRLRTRSEAVNPRNKGESYRLRTMSASVHPGSGSEVVQPRSRSESVRREPKPEPFQQTRTEVVQPRERAAPPPPWQDEPKRKSKCFCGLF